MRPCRSDRPYCGRFCQTIALIDNLADTYFVGMLNDPRQTADFNLFCAGGASMLAQALGRREAGYAKRISSGSF